MANGSLDGSIAHLERAVQLKPDYSDAHNNLGNALMKVPGRSAEAIAEFDEALRLDPGMAQAHANLGLALVKSPGSRAEGIKELRAALRGNEDNPDYAQAHADLGAALAAEPGRRPEAIAEFEAALRLDPGSAEIQDEFAVALNDSGLALARAGRAREAESEFERALPRCGRTIRRSTIISAASWRSWDAVPKVDRAVPGGRAAQSRTSPGRISPQSRSGRCERRATDRKPLPSTARRNAFLPVRPRYGAAWVRSSTGSGALRRRWLNIGRRSAFSQTPPSTASTWALRCPHQATLMKRSSFSSAPALQLEPGYADAHFNLGLALKRAGRDDEAEKEFTASGRRQP